MKRSLLALAVLGVFAGAASAQSSVTIAGRLDVQFANNVGSKTKDIQRGSGNRLIVRGVEDFGGGLSAIFNIEHRWNPDTGTVEDPNRFWNARSFVGLKGGFGEIYLGREYTAAFLANQNPTDPWGYDTVATMAFATSGLIAKNRSDNSINYAFSASGFTVRAQFAETEGNGPLVGGVPSAGQDRPFSFGAAYAAGPVNVGLSYENPADADDKWVLVNAGYNFGMFKLGGAIGSGTNEVGGKHRSYLITATAPISSGELRLAFGQLKNTTLDVLARRQFSVGYHYNLSKRTTVYADLAAVSRDPVPGSWEKDRAYDVGLKHNF